MERRKLIQSGAMGALALISMKATAMTNGTTPAPGLQLSIAISRNHGHDLTKMNADELIILARKIDTEGSATLSIQGRSRHPHNIEMDAQSIMDLILGKDVEIESTLDAGHNHQVILSLN